MSQQSPDDLLNELDALASPRSTAKPTTTSSNTTKPAAQPTEDALLADLASLAERPKTSSRPSTPRAGAKRSVERARTPGSGYGIPPGGAAAKRDSLEKPRTPKAVPSPSAEPEKREEVEKEEQVQEQSNGGGWGWGSIWSTATAAVKTAEGLVKEVQQSEEAKKWADQVKGNTDLLRGLAGDVRSKALPTFTNLLHHLAPPISSHEQLRIHITHDLQNYPFVDTVVYGVFDRVMQQVEGGDLMVVQRGSGSKPRSAADFVGGPWWKDMVKRDLNATHGLQEGIKLAKAAAEGYAQEHAKAATAEPENPENPTRKSNIFLAIQPTIHTGYEGSEQEEKVVSFAIHLYDPEHKLHFSTLSQSLPIQWLEWLDAAPPADLQQGEWGLPDVIRDIMDHGGVDPREWVVEWVEEAVGLSVGVVAQKYVAKRMRIGEAGEMGDLLRKAEQEQASGEEARIVGM